MCHNLHRLSWNEVLDQLLISYVALDLTLLGLKDRCVLQRLLLACNLTTLSGGTSRLFVLVCIGV